MYHVYRFNDDEYLVSIDGIGFGLTSRVETVVILNELEFPFKEIEDALVSLQLHQHQIASFRLNKTLLFTTNIPANEKNVFTLSSH